MPAGIPRAGFVSVSARGSPLHPLLVLVSFPTVQTIYKPWECKESLGKYLTSHPCHSGIQSRKMAANALSPCGSECQDLRPHSGAALISVAAEGQNLQAATFWAR